MDDRQAQRLQVFEAIAAVVEDPIRFLTIVSECRDTADALERVTREYAVTTEIAMQMLETNFRRVTTTERTKIHEEIETLRNRLVS